MEDFVARVGPGLFIALLFVTPWLWGLPAAFASAELSSRQSVEGGYYRWARMHLGEFWGFQSGICSVLSSFLDNALYPVIFARALAFVIPEMGAFEQVGRRFALHPRPHLGELSRNRRDRGDRGRAQPVPAGAGRLDRDRGFHAARDSRPSSRSTWAEPTSSRDLGAALALALWLYSGYGEVSTVAEEVDRPQRNIPLGLLIVTPFVILTYSLPVIAGLVSVGGWENWSSGQFVAIGTELGGSALGRWAFFGSVASQAVIFLTYLLWMSRIAWSMAEDRNLPSWFTPSSSEVRDALSGALGLRHRVLRDGGASVRASPRRRHLGQRRLHHDHARDIDPGALAGLAQRRRLPRSRWTRRPLAQRHRAGHHLGGLSRV